MAQRRINDLASNPDTTRDKIPIMSHVPAKGPKGRRVQPILLQRIGTGDTTEIATWRRLAGHSRYTEKASRSTDRVLWAVEGELVAGIREDAPMNELKAGEPFQPCMVLDGTLIPEAILKESTLSAHARLLWAILAEHQGNNDECFLSQGMLAGFPGRGGSSTPKLYQRA